MDTATMSWVLYSETTNWSKWQTAIVNGGLNEYAKGYDGYALVMGLKFDYLTSPGNMIGLSIDLPNSSSWDKTGFGWILNYDFKTYTGFSYFWDNKQ